MLRNVGIGVVSMFCSNFVLACLVTILWLLFLSLLPYGGILGAILIALGAILTTWLAYSSACRRKMPIGDIFPYLYLVGFMLASAELFLVMVLFRVIS